MSFGFRPQLPCAPRSGLVTTLPCPCSESSPSCCSIIDFKSSRTDRCTGSSCVSVRVEAELEVATSYDSCHVNLVNIGPKHFKISSLAFPGPLRFIAFLKRMGFAGLRKGFLSAKGDKTTVCTTGCKATTTENEKKKVDDMSGHTETRTLPPGSRHVKFDEDMDVMMKFDPKTGGMKVFTRPSVMK